jgi:hypothetical protein
VRALPLLERKRRLLRIVPTVECQLLYLDHIAKAGAICVALRMSGDRRNRRYRGTGHLLAGGPWYELLFSLQRRAHRSMVRLPRAASEHLGTEV